LSNRTNGTRELSVAFLGIRHPHVFPRLSIAQNANDVVVRGFFEENEGIAARFEPETGLPSFSSAEELLRTRPDLVIIEGLDTQVPTLATASAPYARALLLEKPGAPDRRTMDQMVRELGRYDVEVEVGYQLHYSDGIELCREVLGSGALGQVTLARFHAGCPIGCGDELWQSVPGDLGGVMYTEGCHMLELIVNTLGMPESVCGTIKKLPKGSTITSDVVKEDLFSDIGNVKEVTVGNLMYEDVGAAILFYADKVATLDVTSWEATDWVQDWRMEYYGTNGTLTLTPAPPKFQLLLRTPRAGYGAGETTFSGSGGPRGPEVSLVPDAAYHRQLKGLMDRLRENQSASQRSLRTAQGVVHVLDAIYKSSRENMTLTLMD
jgi:predicted dehydrogenase